MYSLDKGKTALRVLVADTYNNLIRTKSDDAVEHLNLKRVKMAPAHFCL